MNERAPHALKGSTEPASAPLLTPLPRKDGGLSTRQRLEILDECSASLGAAAALAEPQNEEVSERNPRPGSRLGVCKCCFRWPISDRRTAAEKLPEAPGRSVNWRCGHCFVFASPAVHCGFSTGRNPNSSEITPVKYKGCNSCGASLHLCLAARSGGARFFALQPFKLPFLKPKLPRARKHD